jgi:flagellar biosynthesis anti-sigma factor FlgM
MKVTGQQPPRTTELATGKSREAEQRAERKRVIAKDSTAPAAKAADLTLSRIRDAIRSTPEVRAERVQAVQEKLRKGEYKVDADRLAHKMINESLRDDVEEP